MLSLFGLLGATNAVYTALFFFSAAKRGTSESPPDVESGGFFTPFVTPVTSSVLTPVATPAATPVVSPVLTPVVATGIDFDAASLAPDLTARDLATKVGEFC